MMCARTAQVGPLPHTSVESNHEIGYCGHPPGDVQAIQEILRISRLVEEVHEIHELDLNPIFVTFLDRFPAYQQ
jgi:hypothetical protein